MADSPVSAERRLNGRTFTRASAVVLRWEVAFFAIMVVALAVRFHGLGWDQPVGAETPLHLHPDERFLVMVADRTDWPDSVGAYFNTAESPLNPYNTRDTNSYVYGTLPLFAVKGLATLAGDDLEGPNNSYATTVMWGRRLTAMTDTVTVALVIALGAMLFGRRAGLGAGLLYALAVLPTQLAHFFTMDPYVTFFAVLTLLLSVLLVRTESAGRLAGLCVATGVAVGLGLACKVTAWPVVLAPVLAFGIRVGMRDFPQLGLRWLGERRQPPENLQGLLSRDISMLGLLLLAALLAFRIAQPYAFNGPTFFDMGLNERWKADLLREIDFQNGNVDFPPFAQFAGRAPFVHSLANMVVFGMGPLMGVAAWLAMGASAVLMFKRREMSVSLLLAFALGVFLFQGPRFVAFMRYFLPMYPVLALFAGWGLIALWDRTRGSEAAAALGRVRLLQRVPERYRSSNALRKQAAVVVVAVFAGTALWAMAFQNVYASEHPRITASRWIYDNIPQGAGITSELWDDSLPVPLPGEDRRYRIVETEPYRPDSEQKVRDLIFGLGGNQNQPGLIAADYVVISSDRVRGTIPRLEREYPATIRYYELLDSGELGFELIKTFTVRPSLLGLEISDARAEEAFTVYDHPTVRIYQKTADFNPDRALALLMEARPERAVNLLPKQGRTNGLQMTPDEAAVQQAGGTFSDVFGPRGLTERVPWLWWLLWMEVVAFAALPWVTLLFRRLPDRGYGLSKVLGMCSVVLPVWLLVSWGVFERTAAVDWGVFGLVALIGVLGYVRRDELRSEFREHWRGWLTLEAVFLGAFAAFLLLRLFNPDTWHDYQGGEKPMELSYLTAVARSTTLPPYDPWFSGGFLNYYYMGWFFLSVPIRMLQILPEVAFNLGIPTFAALAAVGAASTSYNLVGLAARLRAPGASGLRGVYRPALVTAVVGGFLLMGIANLDGGHQWIERLQTVNQWQAAEGVPVVGGAVGIAGGLYQWVVNGAELPPFDWWRSSRVHFGTFDITEFPFWSALFADLHPHLMGLPFFGLVIALGVAYAVNVREGDGRRAWLFAIALGVAVGLVRTVHTWDFPSAVLIGAACIVGGQWFGKGRWDLRFWQAVAHLAAMGALLTLVYLPYTRNFEVFNSGLMRAPETTQPQQFFAQFGLFVTIAVLFIAVRYFEVLKERPAGSNLPLLAVSRAFERSAFALFIAGLTVLSLPFGLTVVALAVVIEVFLLNLLWLEWRSEEPNLGRALGIAVLAAGFGIAAGIDLVIVKNDIERMNTVFKFSLQAWQLFALGGAFGAWYVATALFRFDGLRPSALPGRKLAAFGTAGLVGVLVLGSVLFLYSGTAARQARRFDPAIGPTLDGLAYMDSPLALYREDSGTPNPQDDKTLKLADDLPLIQYLRDEVDGSPVIVEATAGLYHWAGRMAMYTGLPLVIGWDWHQIQQRTDYGALVQTRRAETQAFYRDPDVGNARAFLLKYNVQYVVVGTEELVYGTAEGLGKFEQMNELEEVFRSGDRGQYRIYRVR